MDMDIYETIALLRQFKKTQPTANKAALQEMFVERVSARKQRSVFVGAGYALRFSEVSGDSFSNVVLSLSALQKYDSMPFVICIVRPDRLDFRLANATFLKRISHSSHNFRIDNVRGSLLGHDIMDRYESLPNLPEYFDRLFAIHAEHSWEQNVLRLAEATAAIVARSTHFAIAKAALTHLLDSPNRSARALNSVSFKQVERELTLAIDRDRDKLLRAAILDKCQHSRQHD
jgi:hypothetical protein